MPKRGRCCLDHAANMTRVFPTNEMVFSIDEKVLHKSKIDEMPTYDGGPGTQITDIAVEIMVWIDGVQPELFLQITRL